MPTPFMHLALAERLIADPALPAAAREAITSAWGAFLLGSVAPDARVTGGMERQATHFFAYGPVIDPPPAVAMLREFPALAYDQVDAPARAAFIAGYAAHLAMDETWCTDMLFPRFLIDWATERERWLLLHMLLAILDERDRQALPAAQHVALCAALPTDWLPFVADADLIVWRDVVAAQLAPGAASRTLEILGGRVGLGVDEMNAYLADLARMSVLWAHLPLADVGAIEARMYANVLQTVSAYFEGRL
jgi:hypothetical protein